MGEQQGRAGAMDLVMDADPVAVEFRHFKSWRFALTMSARSCGTLLQIDPIPLGAECPGQSAARAISALSSGTRAAEQIMTTLLSHRTNCSQQNCIASELEHDHSRAQGRHQPGGCQAIRSIELPP